jgi:hypothetical protein
MIHSNSCVQSDEVIISSSVDDKLIRHCLQLIQCTGTPFSRNINPDAECKSQIIQSNDAIIDVVDHKTKEGVVLGRGTMGVRAPTMIQCIQ